MSLTDPSVAPEVHSRVKSADRVPDVGASVGFGTDHILVDNRCVRGIIDFSDVSFGDAEYDFTALFLDLGEEFTLDVAQRYGHSNSELLRKELQYFEVADHIDTIVNGEGWALPGQRAAAWQGLRECVT